MGNINLFFCLIIALCGVYCLYLWAKIRFGGKMPEKNMLMPPEQSMKDCADPEEFEAYMKPRLLIFGAFVFVVGLFGMADVMFGWLQCWTAGLSSGLQLTIELLATCVLPLAGLIWFAVSLRNIQKKLWIL